MYPAGARCWIELRERSKGADGATRNRDRSGDGRPLREQVPRRRGSQHGPPGGGHAGSGGDAPDRGGPDARGQSAAQSRDLRDHLDGARGAADHRGEPPPQLHRSRRVSADRRDRATLHPDARRPLQRPRQDGRRADSGLIGGDHAGCPLPEVELAQAARGRRQAGRPAESRLRRRRPRRLGEVLPLLRRRAEDRAPSGAPLHDRPRGRGAARRREHDRGRGRAGHDVHRAVGRHSRDQRAPRRDREREGPARSAARGCGERRLRLALPVPGLRVGLPAQPCALHQRVRAQVRPGVSRRRVADLP